MDSHDYPLDSPSNETPRPPLGREELINRFTAWLDLVLEAEAPPQGIDAQLLEELTQDERAAQPADTELFSLWSAMTALTQEVKIQGRFFKQVNDSLETAAALGPMVEAQMAAHAQALDEARRIAAQALDQQDRQDGDRRREHERQARREMLGVLLDVRDRLVRGAETGNDQIGQMNAGAPHSLLTRFVPGHEKSLQRIFKALMTFKEGYTMGLERIDEALAQWGVDEIDCEGPFDPRLMNAVDVRTTDEWEDGAVIEVYQHGYMWKGELLRTAQVSVARRPQSHGHAGESRY